MNDNRYPKRRKESSNKNIPISPKHKKLVIILWTLSLTILLGGVFIAQFKPFNDKGSGLLIWISFNSALLAMTFSAIREKSNFKIALYITYMICITIKVVLDSYSYMVY